jgi:hypothetical protein
MAWHFSGWNLDRTERADLLKDFPPHYGDVIADHVTLETGKTKRPAPPPVDANIVGCADDGRGVQAFVVEIDGSSRRPDGSTFHVTWSIERKKGRRAVESNDVIRERGWTPLARPRRITLRPVGY